MLLSRDLSRLGSEPSQEKRQPCGESVTKRSRAGSIDQAYLPGNREDRGETLEPPEGKPLVPIGFPPLGFLPEMMDTETGHHGRGPEGRKAEGAGQPEAGGAGPGPLRWRNDRHRHDLHDRGDLPCDPLPLPQVTPRRAPNRRKQTPQSEQRPRQLALKRTTARCGGHIH